MEALAYGPWSVISSISSLCRSSLTVAGSSRTSNSTRFMAGLVRVCRAPMIVEPCTFTSTSTSVLLLFSSWTLFLISSSTLVFSLTLVPMVTVVSLKTVSFCRVEDEAWFDSQVPSGESELHTRESTVDLLIVPLNCLEFPDKLCLSRH